MARTVLPVQQISRAGLDLVFTRSDGANGHSFDNTGHNVFLLVRDSIGLDQAVATIITPNTIDGQTIADRAISVPITVAAAIADDGGTQVDETSEANSPTTDDMTLLPAVPEVNDAYYFGNDAQFNQLAIEISTAGAGSWTIVWEYWDSSGWVALPGIEDDTAGFTVGTKNYVSWQVMPDWTPITVNGQGPFWWVRARVSVYTSITTQPAGEQVTIPGIVLIGPFPEAVYDTVDTDPDPIIDPAVFVDVSGAVGLEFAAVKLPGASY